MTLDPNDPKLTAYALGELDDAERAAVEKALDDSPALREAVEEIRRTADLLAEHLQSEPAPALTPEQRQAVLREPDKPPMVAATSKPRTRRRFPLALTAAVCALLAVGAAAWILPTIWGDRPTGDRLALLPDPSSSKSVSEGKPAEPPESHDEVDLENRLPGISLHSGDLDQQRAPEGSLSITHGGDSITVGPGGPIAISGEETSLGDGSSNTILLSEGLSGKVRAQTWGDGRQGGRPGQTGDMAGAIEGLEQSKAPLVAQQGLRADDAEQRAAGQSEHAGRVNVNVLATDDPGNVVLDEEVSRQLRTTLDKEGGRIGPVQVEPVPGTDILVIRGHQRDVQQVTEMVEQIEQMSEEPQPADAEALSAEERAKFSEGRARLREEQLRQHSSLADFYARFEPGAQPSDRGEKADSAGTRAGTETLLGGRALPQNAGNVMVVDGKVVAKPEPGRPDSDQRDKKLARIKTWRRAKATPNASRLMVGDKRDLPLEGMQANVQLVAPDAELISLAVYGTD